MSDALPSIYYSVDSKIDFFRQKLVLFKSIKFPSPPNSPLVVINLLLDCSLRLHEELEELEAEWHQGERNRNKIESYIRKIGNHNVF